MSDRPPRVSGAEIVLLLALVAWGMFPIALQLAYAAHVHASFTGADGLIGADGVLGADQLQYLGWVRDAGGHGLISDLFTLAPNSHVYLQPLFAISGVLWRLGVSLQVAYLVWKPIAALALFVAALVWARRMFPDEFVASAAAVTLALFLYTPLAALYGWTGMGSGQFRFQLYLLGDELLSATKLWGYVPSAIGAALVPLSLLGVARALDPYQGRDRLRQQLDGVRPGLLILAAFAAGLASWLHPWQGITLVLIFAGVAVWQRLAHWRALALPAVAAGLPLLYYYLLSHNDAAWHLASQYEMIGRLQAVVLLAGFGPLFLIAAVGLRNPGEVVIEQMLLLWIAGAFVTYFINGEFSSHALQGLSFPLAVLAVRGWQRLRLGVLLGTIAVLLVTIPGLAYDTRKFVRTARNTKLVQYYLPQPDVHALKWLGSAAAPPGGVLAPTPFATVVPSQTGRAVWVGHGYWSPDYQARAGQVDALFRGHMRPGQARAFVRGTGATLLIADCNQHGNLARLLRPLIRTELHFGCARVYELKLDLSASR